MIPSTWRPHWRADDGELVGYLEGSDPSVVARTLFGYALTDAVDEDSAIRELEARGLACLTERWQLRLPTGDRVPVVIMSAYADRVEVVQTEYGVHGPDSPRHVVPAPTGDRLVPAG